MIKQSFEGSQNPLDVLYAETQTSQRAKAEALRGFKPRDSKDAEAPYTRPPSVLETVTIPASYALDFLADEFDRLAGRTKEEAVSEDIVAAYPGPAIVSKAIKAPLFDKAASKKEVQRVVQDLFTENPLKLDRKTIGRQLNESLGDLSPYSREGAMDRQREITGALGKTVLTEIGESRDPYLAAERLLQKKGIKGVKISKLEKDSGGSFGPNKIEAEENALLHEIQHADEFKKYGSKVFDRPEQSGTGISTLSDLEIRDILFGARTGDKDISSIQSFKKAFADSDKVEEIIKYLNAYKTGRTPIVDFEDPRLIETVRGSLSKERPDLYLIDLIRNKRHFIEPAGEIDVGLINAAKHGALEIPESIEPYWEQMLREFLEQRAKESKGATVDFGVKPKKSE